MFLRNRLFLGDLINLALVLGLVYSAGCDVRFNEAQKRQASNPYKD
jgi:hypothetical protein